VQLDHCSLGGDLGRHRPGQGVKRRLADGGGQARVLSTARQGLGEAPETFDRLILPVLGPFERALYARGDQGRLLGSLHQFSVFRY